MKRTVLITTLVLAVVMTVVSGCDPTLGFDGSRKVKFTVKSASSLATKTSSGSLENGYWTIDWTQSTDQIRIYSPNTGVVTGYDGTATLTPTDPSQELDYSYSDYTIEKVSRSGHVSSAQLKNVGENGLSWLSNSTATFYGAYPKDVKICSTTDHKLRFAVEIPGVGTSGQTGKREDVSKMPLLAIQTVENGGEVTLDFYPAFSTYEFELRSFEDNMTIYSVEFSSGTTTDYVTGMCYYDLNKLSSGSHFLPNNLISYESGNTSIKFDFGESGKAVSESQNIYLTFFTLPRAYTNPVIKVDCKVNGMRSTKKLVLKKTDSDLTFPAGSFAQINGVEVKGDFLCFKTITVNGTVVAWDTVDDQNPAILPQASQFNVKGTGVLNVYDEHKGEGDPTSPDYDPDYGKPYRQYWVVPEGVTATVSFKIVTPRTGTYTIEPIGDVSSFTLTGCGNDLSIPADGKISFTVTPNTSESKTIHFKTSITTSDGVTYNIDSETQLFDIRGYHYFVTKDPLPHLNP